MIWKFLVTYIKYYQTLRLANKQLFIDPASTAGNHKNKSVARSRVTGRQLILTKKAPNSFFLSNMNAQAAPELR